MASSSLWNPPPAQRTFRVISTTNLTISLNSSFTSLSKVSFEIGSSKYSGLDMGQIISRLRVEALDLPAALLLFVDKPFVEAAAAGAPEFDLERDDPDPRPMRRSWHGAHAKLNCELTQA